MDFKVKKGETVEEWLDRLPTPQSTILAELRQLIFANAPHLTERIMWSAPWFVGKDHVIYLVCHSKYATFGVCKGAHLEDPDGLMEGTGKRMRHVKVTSFESIPKKKLVGLLKRAVEYDRLLD